MRNRVKDKKKKVKIYGRKKTSQRDNMNTQRKHIQRKNEHTEEIYKRITKLIALSFEAQPGVLERKVKWTLKSIANYTNRKQTKMQEWIKYKQSCSKSFRMMEFKFCLQFANKHGKS